MTKISKTDTEWRELLTTEQYNITRKHGTERAFTGPYQDEKRDGTFTCVCCGNNLFALLQSLIRELAGQVFTSQWTKSQFQSTKIVLFS